MVTLYPYLFGMDDGYEYEYGYVNEYVYGYECGYG